MGESVQSNQGVSPREGGPSPHARRRAWLLLAFVLLVAALVGVAALALYARGGGPVPQALGFLAPTQSSLLAPSSSAETTLRALRLAGIERAVVGSSGGTAVVRVEVPSTSSATDVSLAWQAATGALVSAYPSANAYVVQLFAPGALPLAEVTVPGPAARAAVSHDDVMALRSAATVAYLGAGGR